MVPRPRQEGRSCGGSRGRYPGTKGRYARFPNSSAIESAKSIALRELRIQSGGHALRVFYVFDPIRRAVLLIGGDKTGDDRFYEKFIPMAERIYGRYLREIK